MPIATNPQLRLSVEGDTFCTGSKHDSDALEHAILKLPTKTRTCLKDNDNRIAMMFRTG